MEVIIGARDAKFVEEDLRHIVVVVLPRVDDDFLYLVGVVCLDGATQSGGLDDLGSCPDDGDDFHGCFGLRVDFAFLEEAVVVAPANDEVVDDLDVKQFASGDEFLGEAYVVGTRLEVSRRVVVGDDDEGGADV